MGLADYLALGINVLRLSPPGARPREVPRHVTNETRRRPLPALIALTICIVVTIIIIFENLRLGSRCGLFARLFLHGFRVPPGGVRPVAFASSTKMRRWRWHVFNEKRKKKKQKLAKLGNGEPVTTPLSSVVRKLNKLNRNDRDERLLSGVHEDVQK